MDPVICHTEFEIIIIILHRFDSYFDVVIFWYCVSKYTLGGW